MDSGGFVAVNNPKECDVPAVGSDDEDSFVVLETSPSLSENDSSKKEEVLAPIRTNKVHEMQNLTKMKLSQINADPMPELPAAVDALDAVASSVANITISRDSSYEEIQKQVEELIKENEKLKNIIAQNNLSMKTQYARFLSYRDEVTNVMKSYKDKFNEAKICIDRYKEDNTKLAGDVEVYINIKKLHEEEIINLKQKTSQQQNSHLVDVRSEQNVTEMELNVANEKIKDLQTALADANLKNTELRAYNEKFKQDLTNAPKQSEVDQLSDQIKDLQTALDDANLKNTELRAYNEKFKQDLTNAPKESEVYQLSNQIKDLNVKLLEINKENTKLTATIEDLNAKLLDVNKENTKLITTIEDLKQNSYNTSKIEGELITKKREVEKLTKQLVTTPKLEEELQNKQRELDDLNLKIAASENHKLSLCEKIAKLQTENSELKIRLNSVSIEKEKLVQSTNVAATYEDQIRQKDIEIQNLRRDNLRSRSVENNLSEEVIELKMKLQSHQDKYNPRLLEDFSQARTQLSISQKTITALEQEREIKIKEIEDLRKLLQESSGTNDEMYALKEQLTLYKNDFEAEKEAGTAIKREKDQLAEDLQNLQKRNKQLQNEIDTLRARDQPKVDGYVCPKCTFAFTTYQSLENHVHRCLDLDGFP